MRVWTDGARARVWHPRGRFCVTSRGEVTWEKRGGGGPGPLVALTDAGKDLLAHAPPLEAAVRIAAVAVDAERTAEIRLPTVPPAGGSRCPVLRIGVPDGEPDLELPLVGRPPSVGWPHGVLAESIDPDAWADDEVFAAAIGDDEGGEVLRGAGLRLTRSPFGLGIGAGASGHVAVLRAADVELEHLGRLPVARGRRPPSIEVMPLSEGALVCVAAAGPEGWDAALLLLGDGGDVVAHWPREGSLRCGAAAPRLALTSSGALVSHGSMLSLLRLPSLEPLANLRGEEPIVDLACADDGIAALGAASLRLGRVTGEALSFDEPLALDALEDGPNDGSGWRPEQETGPTNVEAALQKVPPWRAKAGEPFRLELRLRSIGRAGRALQVRASGPALEAGHVTLLRAWTGDDEAPFDEDGAGAVARLEGAAIPQGYKRPVVPKPKNPDQKLTAQALLEGSRLDLTLEGRALAPGRALLKLEIGGVDGAPFRWTRPFLVE